jgi:hypothetical protein
LLIAVEKFTKWIEAKFIAKTDSSEAVKFFLDTVYRFGVPNTIIIDKRDQPHRQEVLGLTGRRLDTHAPTGRLRG